MDLGRQVFYVDFDGVLGDLPLDIFLSDYALALEADEVV